MGIRKHPSGGIGLADYVGTFQKTGNYICNNVNSYGGSPNVVIEEVTPIYYSSNCTNSQNWPPVAYAGNDQTITLPTSVVTFAGSGIDPDGTITSYQWTKIAGPATFIITSPTAAQTAVNNLEEGEYIFELTVIDNQGAVGKDTILVTVKSADSKKSELTSVYPNPAVTTITIKISNAANANKALIKIYSSVGVLAYQTEIVLSQQVTIFTVDVSKFTKGAYFIKIEKKQNGKNEVLTFMKL